MKIRLRRFARLAGRRRFAPYGSGVAGVVAICCGDFRRLAERLPERSLVLLRDWHRHHNGELCQEWELETDALQS